MVLSDSDESKITDLKDIWLSTAKFAKHTKIKDILDTYFSSWAKKIKDIKLNQSVEGQ